MSHHILDFCHNNFFLVAPMALLVKFLDYQVKRPFQKYILPPPPPPPPIYCLNVQNVLGHTQILTYSRCIFKVIEFQLYSLRHFRMIPNSFDCQEQLSRFNKLVKQPEGN